jgi:3-hydroxyacyl-[acyl-carrier-protein] dehydratase
MPEPLSEPRQWENAPLVYGLDHIQQRIPQRFEMALLHGIAHHDLPAKLAVGIHDARPTDFWVRGHVPGTWPTDFWVRGHVPGRPLMPGVVMVEMAAQLCAWLASFERRPEPGQFFAFGGIDNVRFRGQVVPGDRVVIGSKIVRWRGGVGQFQTQGFVRGELVYQGDITGILV